ncbi:hypothetical protein GA0070607_5441 [Micromonospora coriariae]|uniref:Uncharacterized protein n=1 Tax=Micromonospora coriariae TaxID=285665 RepID=A0A1C4XLK7_9ACTN|nr:hypothetical protein [Micromonospora coriariae]SCF09212.1 hypothetical protein GA0070607_5441 [Micromonospora coriariae]
MLCPDGAVAVAVSVVVSGAVPRVGLAARDSVPPGSCLTPAPLNRSQSRASRSGVPPTWAALTNFAYRVVVPVGEPVRRQ